MNIIYDKENMLLTMKMTNLEVYQFVLLHYLLITKCQSHHSSTYTNTHTHTHTRPIQTDTFTPDHTETLIHVQRKHQH